MVVEALQRQREREKQRQRQRERDRERERDRQTERETEAETEREPWLLFCGLSGGTKLKQKLNEQICGIAYPQADLSNSISSLIADRIQKFLQPTFSDHHLI